jgi:hypothetical protein
VPPLVAAAIGLEDVEGGVCDRRRRPFVINETAAP